MISSIIAGRLTDIVVSVQDAPVHHAVMCTSVLKNNWIIHTVGSVVQTNEAVVL